MSLRSSLIGGACLSLQPLLLNALSIPAMAFIIRGLGPDGFGQWTMATALIGAVAALTNLGLRGAFIRHIAADPRDLAAAVSQQLGLRLALASVGGLLALLICVLLNYPPIVLACVAVGAVAMLLATFATTLIDVLQSMHRSRTIAAVSLLAGLLLTAASVLVIWLKMGPIAVSLAYLVGPAVSSAVLWKITRQFVPVRIGCGLENARRLIARSRSFTAQQIFNSATSYAEALLLPRLIGIANFGFFNAGTLLPLRLAAVPDGMCTAAYPLLSRRFREEHTGGTQLALRFLCVVPAICTAIALLVALLAGRIAYLLFPSQSEICRDVILLTIWALPLMSVESVLGYAINAAGADAAHARASLPAAVCNVTLTVILMTQLGIAGASIAIPLRHAVRIILLGVCFARHVYNVSDEPIPDGLTLA